MKKNQFLKMAFLVVAGLTSGSLIMPNVAHAEQISIQNQSNQQIQVNKNSNLIASKTSNIQVESINTISPPEVERFAMLYDGPNQKLSSVSYATKNASYSVEVSIDGTTSVVRDNFGGSGLKTIVQEGVPDTKLSTSQMIKIAQERCITDGINTQTIAEEQREKKQAQIDFDNA